MSYITKLFLYFPKFREFFFFYILITKNERFLLFLIESKPLLFFYFRYFFYSFCIFVIFNFLIKLKYYFFGFYLRTYSYNTIQFKYKFFLPYKYSFPYRFGSIELLKNISLFFYNFVSYIINGTIFSFFFISTTLFLFVEVLIMFFWSILIFFKLFFQRLYYNVLYYMFLKNFALYYTFYMVFNCFMYFLLFILFFMFAFWLFNLDFISEYVNFIYYSGRFSQSFNTFAQIKMLPMDHHFSLWWLIRIYLIYLFLFFINISTRKYIIQHGFIIIFIPLLISFTSYRMFITNWLTYIFNSQIGHGRADRKIRKLYGLSRYSQFREAFRGLKYQSPNQEFFRPFVRPILRHSDLADRGINTFRIAENRTGSDLRRFYDINIASEIDSYKYDQLRMEQLKAVIFFLEEEEFQREVKRTITQHQMDTDEVIPETGERITIDPAVKLRTRPFSGVFLPAPSSYEHIEPRLPSDVEPIIDFENISLRDSDEDIQYIFVPMADQKRKEWWEYEGMEPIKDNEPTLIRLESDKQHLSRLMLDKLKVEDEEKTLDDVESKDDETIDDDDSNVSEIKTENDDGE